MVHGLSLCPSYRLAGLFPHADQGKFRYCRAAESSVGFLSFLLHSEAYEGFWAKARPPQPSQETFVEALLAECRQLASRKFSCTFSPAGHEWNWFEKAHSRRREVGYPCR